MRRRQVQALRMCASQAQQKKLYYFPQMPENRGMKMIRTIRWGSFCSTLMLFATGSQLALGADIAFPAIGTVRPPPGFTALFNGKDLTGWRGGDTVDPHKIPPHPPRA